MQKILYFDYVALPIFLIILYATIARKMTKGLANKLFIYQLIASVLSCVCDLGMEVYKNRYPVSDPGMVRITLFSYGYFLVHNAMTVLYFLFIYAITRTWYILRTRKAKVFACLPYAVLVLIVLTNPIHQQLFTITRDAGYQRGRIMWILYAIAVGYAIFGLAHLISCIRFLRTNKWVSLISMYVVTFIAVFFQFFHPDILVEMVAEALATLYIALVVLRPEESVDTSVGLPSFKAYKEDLRKITTMHQSVQFVVIKFINASEMREYLGEIKYGSYIRVIADAIHSLLRKGRVPHELFFEHPGTFYTIIDDMDFDPIHSVPKLEKEVNHIAFSKKGTGAKLDCRICSIRYPEDLDDYRSIIHFGHHFTKLIPYEQKYTRAADCVKSKDFEIINKMEDILSKAIMDRSFEIYYQPIYSIWDKKFISAEALIRLKDEQYGMISPASFIPEAERRGLILPIGDFVLDEVHKFASENELEKLGLSYIEVNLSVAQCLQRELPDKMKDLSTRYGVGPEKVNLEITETSYENIGEIMDDNLRILSEQGYSFSLDDYGIGYSNIQRVSRLPLKIIKIDKSLVDNMVTDAGKSIMKNTVRMMKDIKKELVIEGVETKEDLDELEKMGCDFIQGFYFSKPLPAAEFIDFLKEKNFAC